MLGTMKTTRQAEMKKCIGGSSRKTTYSIGQVITVSTISRVQTTAATETKRPPI